jgi:cell division protein FtsQ
MGGGLISPRRGAYAVTDVGGRSTLVGRQRVGRARRHPARSPARGARVARAAVLAIVGAAALGAAVHWLATSPRFAVAAVDVHGASRVSVERILGVAGIRAGTHLWSVSPADVVARVESLPEVRRADVIRDLPNRVTIRVEERRPFTLVHAGRLHWLDEEGRVLGEEREAVSPPVPVISGLTEDELASLRTAPTAKTRAAISLIRALLRSGSALAAEISEIDMSRKEGPVLYTVDGVEVRLGQEEWEERLARLEGVLGQIAHDDVSAVDLRFRDQVVLRKGGR